MRGSVGVRGKVYASVPLAFMREYIMALVYAASLELDSRIRLREQSGRRFCTCSKVVRHKRGLLQSGEIAILSRSIALAILDFQSPEWQVAASQAALIRCTFQ